jgi:hypothetical protein
MFRRGPKITRNDFFFNRREKKIFLLVIRVAAIAAGTCLVIVLLVSGIVGSVRGITGTPASGSVTVENPAGQPEPREEKAEPLGERTPRLTLSDFMLPDQVQRLLEPDKKLYRERTGRWDEQSVGEYWVPPADIGLEKLRELNDKNIERLFEDVQ